MQLSLSSLGFFKVTELITEPPHKTREPKRILVADDETMIRELISSVLKPEGYQVTTVANGEEALSLMNHQLFDLLFLDIRMPRLNGVEFLDKFNETNQGQCPIVIITGQHDDQVTSQCYDQGVFAVLRKPLHNAEIIALSKRYTNYVEIKKQLHSQRNLLDQLRYAPTPMAQIIEELPVPLFYLDNNLVYRQINKAFSMFTGLTADDILNKTIFDIAPEGTAKKITKIEKDILKTGNLQSNNELLKDCQGKVREVVIYRTPIINETAWLLGLIVDVSDYDLSSFSKRLSVKCPNLTQRELEIANLVRLNMTNKEISEQLDISLSTVEFHRNNLREKLGLKGSRANLSAILMAV